MSYFKAKMHQIQFRLGAELTALPQTPSWEGEGEGKEREGRRGEKEGRERRGGEREGDPPLLNTFRGLWWQNVTRLVAIKLYQAGIA